MFETMKFEERILESVNKMGTDEEAIEYNNCRFIKTRQIYAKKKKLGKV